MRRNEHILFGETRSDGQDSGVNRSKLAAGLLSFLAVGLLLALMGFTTASSAIVFVVVLPFLVLFSPVVLPAAIAVAAAMLAFGVCGAVGLGGLWALRWAVARLKGGDGVGSGSGRSRTVGRAVTEAGHEVRVLERDVGGYSQREVQVKGAKGRV